MKHQSAFTLVELAIVIVIIGLLVGGVLQGQALIQQSKIQSMIKDVESYRSAMISYKGKFNFPPGDDPNAYNYFGNACDSTPSNCNGNGNNLIEDTYTTTTVDNEALRFWQHLSLSKFIKGTYTGTGNRISSVPRTQFPSVFVTTANGVPNNSTNYFLVGYTLFNTAEGAFLKPEESYSLDLKIDDGLPNVGKLITYPDGWSASNMPNCKTGTGSTAVYNISYDNLGCHAVFVY